MTATTAQAVHGPLLVRLSRWLLTRTVRGNATEGTTWGEAMLSELDEATTTAETVRWTISSLPVAWRERRKRRSAVRAAQSTRVRVARRVVTSLAVVLIGGFVLNTFVVTIRPAESQAMAKTYPISSKLVVDKIGYHVTGLGRGDIVILNMRPIDGADDTMIMRVVGLAGDAMACDATTSLTRDGTVIAGPPGLPPVGESSRTCTPVTVPAGDIYLLGDDFYNSFDSRIFGPVPASSVFGRVVGKVWPW